MPHRFSLPAAVFLGFILIAAHSANAGLNLWTPIGPSAAHGVTRVITDPHDPSVLYAQTLDFRLWRSEDSGSSWGPITAGLPGFVRAFAADAESSGVLYTVAGSSADSSLSVWRSTDRGDSWNKVFQGSPAGTSQIALFADSGTSGTLYQMGDGRLSKSTDGGRTWGCVPVLFPCATGPRLILTGFAVDPASSERIYAINNVGLVYRSTDSGATWSDGAVLQPLFGLGVNRITVSPSDPEIVYAWVSGGGVTGRPCFARSNDRGESWTGRLSGVQCGELSVDPEDGQTLRILVGPERRLWTSHDGGETWTQGGTAPGSGQILRDANDPSLLLLAGSTGLFRSEDGGDHWSRWAQRGFNNAGIRVLLASAEAPGVLYASLAVSTSALPRPLQKSTNAGRTWTELPLRGVGALAVDPQDPRHLYAVNELEESRVQVNRVYESADGGLTWQLAAERPFPTLTSFGTARITGLRVHPLDSRILYASTEGGGVFRSADRGRTWRSTNQGLPARAQCGSTACPANAASEIVLDRIPRILYVVFDGDVYRSINQGRNWALASEGLPESTVTALAADPDRSSVLYAAGAVPPTSAGFISAIFRSTDGGRQWTRVAAYPSAVLDITVSRSGVYASTASDGVFRSTDGGRSWAGVSQGLPDVSIPLLSPDPLIPGRIYAGTAVEGIWGVRFVATP